MAYRTPTRMPGVTGKETDPTFMATADTPPASPDGDAAPGRPSRHRGTGRFIAVFVVVVIGLLTGYRYAIDTTANDWYLFQVARHTGWVLDVLGHSADLEKPPGSGLNAATVRAELSGSAAPPSGVDERPLTPWEHWRYRARKARDDGENHRALGPQVNFVLSPGLQHRVAALESALSLSVSAEENGPETEAEREALNDQLQALRAEMASSSGDPALRRAQRGRFFTFIVVPECGAIEIMAIFFAAVLAFPAPWRRSLLGLGVGLPIMYLVNILRLVCLAFIGALDTSGQWFQFVHEYVWQAVYVIFVVVVWIAWVEFVVKRRPV